MKFGDSVGIIGAVTFLVGIVLSDYLNSKQNVDFTFYVFSIALMVIGLVIIGLISVYKIISKRYNHDS